MKKKSKGSKLNVALSALLVIFVSLLTFSIGVITGKGWSDRETELQQIRGDQHLKSAMEDTEPLGDEMSDKEVKLLTQRALEEAHAEQPAPPQPEPEQKPEETAIQDDREPASDKMAKNEKKKEEGSPEGEESEGSEGEEGEEEPEVSKAPMGREASQATKVADNKRNVSSLRKPTTPKPTAIEYTVQVAAYKTVDEAEVHSQKLIDKGFPAFPVRAIIAGEDWYRVSIGSFKSRKQAMKYQQALKKQAVVTDTIIQKIERLKK